MIYGIALCVHLSPSKGTGCVYRTIARALEGGQYDALHGVIRGTIIHTLLRMTGGFSTGLLGDSYWPQCYISH